MLKKTSTIGSAAVILTFFALIVKATGFFREILFANYYGTNRDYEYFLVSSVLPITINSIALYFYQNYFIPTYSKIKGSDNFNTLIFVRNSFLLSFFTGLIVSVLLIIMRKPVLDFYIGVSPDINYPETMFVIFCLTIPFSFVSAFLTSYAQSQFNFKLPAFSLLAINFSTIIAILIFQDSGIVEISLGYFFGVIFQMIILIILTGILKKIKFAGSLKKIAIPKDLNKIIWVILIEVIGQIYILSDRYFLSKVDEGGIAAINYATTIFLLPISIITLSISTAILPQISDYVSTNKLTELKNDIRNSLVSILLIFVPISLIFIVWGREIIIILFERGSFDSNSSYLTYKVLVFLSLSLCFYSLYGVINKLFYVLDKVKILFMITVVGIVVKLSFNFFLVDSLKQNGLALATTISYLVFFILSVIIIQIKENLLEIFFLTKKFILYLMNGIIAYLVVSTLSTFSIFDNYIVWIVEIISFLLIFYVSNQILDDNYQTTLRTTILRFIPFSGKR